ncbi:uncharacterized protein BO66DRAFT_463274 [Aspergillus aculeatinus CBS 121060]|uniref:Uncharacterized protein n=1 Tax=Aspergillus aculeatinus CBS 121060 TaxID=1448322 RepID=A0ACD1GUJ0_9EURO|nr:hypothetical protein BO66DRAFT_463274 [Aspergillus aculeatinus CBS 121060]RAH65002.1 hypothetical protein BO66DRAFT_463274 [Aspergillus aculeatinus CBS 121060]
MSEQIQKVAVIGCGVIGAGWASLFLARGLDVTIYDPAEGAENSFKHYLQDAWPSLQASMPIGDLPVTKYTFVKDLATSLRDVDFVQENGPERADFKVELMKTLDQHTRPGVVIASSSSGLPASGFIERCQQDPGRILVGHPFNPAHLVPLVEVVPHPATDSSAIATAMGFYRSLGKRPVLLHQEIPGFVANRLQAAINNEAYSLISRGVISAEDLDTAVTSGPGLRWALTGPIVTNALGGGGGSGGFAQRIERLGPSIQAWEENISKHRFAWSFEAVEKLNQEARKWLETVDWQNINATRDQMLLKVLAAKSSPSSRGEKIERL